jgi:hypothetical protein
MAQDIRRLLAQAEGITAQLLAAPDQAEAAAAKAGSSQ